MAAAALRFKRPLRLFQTRELHTRIVGWDQKWGYLETTFTRNGQAVATVIAKAAARGREGTIPPEKILVLLGQDREPVPVPEHIRRWVEAEPTMT